MMIKAQLAMLKDEDYANFQRRLIPEATNIIGVRTPLLRKMAKQLSKQYDVKCLQWISDDSYEEVLLQGMLIAYSKLTFQELFPYIQAYVSKINNWSLCDLFVSSLKITSKHLDEMYPFLLTCLQSEQTYEVRFAIVMLFNYYKSEVDCQKALQYFEQLHTHSYYVQMAIAWAISVYFVRFKAVTLKYLENNHLDDFTYQKALQKIIEKRTVSEEDKQLIRGMKRNK
ncbi:MAG: DNA alkylation repair protein [Erysipelotrichia bacterium]|nr:DNA alkylation repair protein [Erysipelotrichia bacterium]NCC55014.1 DNA alkylation repair protein [Erysipelotrichia bacterium]